jgi:hypothetical protein
MEPKGSKEGSRRKEVRLEEKHELCFSSPSHSYATMAKVWSVYSLQGWAGLSQLRYDTQRIWTHLVTTFTNGLSVEDMYLNDLLLFCCRSKRQFL